jgi:hypothetical protein
MPPEIAKAQRRRLRELASLAYERELSSALGELEGHFLRWRRGEITAFDVSAAIHDFHQGVSRDLFSRHQADPELVVAGAIHEGVISSDEAGSDTLEHLAGHLAALRSE